MSRRAIWGCCLVLAAVGATALAADWPQFHGPRRDNTSAETNLPRSFPAGGPKVLWTVKVGAGYGGGAIQGGKVYLLDRPDRRNDLLRCLDLETGKEEWTYSYAAPGRVSHDGSRSTPAVDGKFVFTVGGFGHVHCISKATKEPVWKKHLLRDYGGGRLPRWGVSQSPLLYKDWVIVAPQGRDVGVVALERATGKEAWRSESFGKMDYVSPIVTTIAGVEQVVMVNAGGAVGIDAANGKLLWRYGGWRCRIPIPNVTPVGDGRLFVVGGYNGGCAMIKVAKTDDGLAATELWKNGNCNSQMNTAVLHEGRLYANSNSNSDRDGMVCMDLDGKVLWRTEREPNFERGHMLFADGMIFIIDGRAGSLHLVEPSPEGFKQLAQADGLLGGREIWGPLALSGGKLIIRDQSKMLCLDLRAK